MAFDPHCIACIALRVRPCARHTDVSVGADSLDHMVESASVPDLADLVRRAKSRGLIQAGKDYGDK